ncbi:hypothetical protein EMIHUDRAFT_467364 [Emiliania huxleyi CCMP1516]|uniref:Mono(ADP-ribosyl)transferase n=2 Tax=Emiliania huxleyi TaxID=2903 RepID=A0A0D3KJ42_EMIH1|nr:hypothetical protein EMIHUDRAFT_467364 [Emiliania huxleyi CCMP1516]EOD35777.1 hypothetical protein EMIHUDRAFT_467364 [Emiliania huxleyi CCMP1516]|eukprot:XP_005788206.1 hypothetical protein EMIHUDRAFT_467364 [Emiliania huxleyi CCMP1516]
MGCTASKMEHAVTDDINGRADIEEARAEIQSLKDEIQALKDENQALKDENQALKAGTPDDSDKCGTSRYIKADALVNKVQELKIEVQSLKAGSTPDGSDKLGTSRDVKALEDEVQSLKAEKPDGSDKFGTSRDVKARPPPTPSIFLVLAGLEALVGAPLMVDGSLFKAMETEHCGEKDADVPFDTSNGIKGATSKLEWEFVVAPVEDQDGRYAERGGDFRTAHSEWCRKPEPLPVYEAKMADEMNPRLEAAGQAPLTKEELVAGRLYTGPMYEKYNAVLRFFAALGADGAVRLVYASMEEVPFLQKKCGWLHLGEWVATAAGKGEPAAVRWTWNNKYTTTIHAINSIIVKLSPLTKITPLYRGWAGATLPEAFFKPDALGFRGGVEYGFSSTTTDRAQAVHYAEGKASTVLELGMGMIDRGADIAWLSQYPHERETLLPPLMGLQVRSTGVEGSTIVIQSSFSINMASLTLEQVAGKRKKLLTDMGAQMAAEVRRGVAGEAAEEASQLVRVHLGLERCADAGAADERLEAPLGDEAEAYNNDLRFQAAVGDALKVKRAAVLAATMQHGGGSGLAAAMDTVLPLQASGVDLTGFPLGTTGWIKASEVEGESKEVGAKVIYQGREMVVSTGVTRDSEDEEDGKLKLVDDGMVGTVVAWMESEPSALTSLTLDWGKVCGRVREALLGAVRKTHTLVALSVGEIKAMPLNPLQLNGREAVPSLELSSKFLGPASAAVVAAGVSVNGVLTYLSLRGNGIGDEGAKALASALRVNAVLTNLNLHGNSIGAEGAKAIGEALAVNGVLKYLNLWGNSIGDTGATAIADALRGNGVLTDLNLGHNQIRNGGAAAIVEALRVNGVLKTLNLDGHQLDLPKLRGTDSVTSLDLSRKSLGPVSAIVIASLVSGNEVLKSINLEYTNLGPTGATAIAEALRGNGVLTSIDLQGNNFSKEGKKAIQDAVSGREGFKLKM